MPAGVRRCRPRRMIAAPLRRGDVALELCVGKDPLLSAWCGASAGLEILSVNAADFQVRLRLVVEPAAHYSALSLTIDR